MQIVINVFVSLCMVFFYEIEVVINLYFEKKNNCYFLNIYVLYIYCILFVILNIIIYMQCIYIGIKFNGYIIYYY